MTTTTEITDPMLLEFAADVGVEGPVTVRGGSTKWAVGGAVDDRVREVGAPAGIVDLRPEEMVAHVRAATLVSDLHGELARAGQRTALADEPDATVGGTLAAGRSGIGRLGRGSVRDVALQIRYVSAEGDLVTAGGPTVKNVSGFDLCRLMVGSLGTLGCIGDVIVRTLPIPERESWFRFEGIEPNLVVEAARTAASVLWDGSSTWTLLAGYEVDVAADLTSLDRHGPAAVDGPPALPPYRWSRRPSQLASLAGRAGFVAEVGVGIVHAEAADEPRPLTRGVATLHERVKQAFDPTGRLNPGRRPENR